MNPIPNFDYLILVDLETTCDSSDDPNRQEIVEWPWVVYDVQARGPVDHKQLFVAPAWNTNPNPAPSTVRGLGLDVAYANSLKEAVAHFDAYLYHSFATYGKSFCILTDGPWDVQHLLLLEAARKAVRLAPHFRAFFNLRAEFTARYPAVGSPRDRHTMLTALGINRTPSNTGIDHCVAIADIVTRMLYDGHVFNTPFVIPEYDWSAAVTRVPAVAAPVAAAVPVGGIVRLRGLPWTCTEMDIVRFLQPIAIVPAGIHFVRNSQGKATGEAFVQLESEDAVKAAMARNRQSIGRRYIEIFKSSPSDMTSHLGRADARRHMHPHSQAQKSAAAAAAVAAATRSNGRGHTGRAKPKNISPHPTASATVIISGAAPATGSATGLAYVVHVSGLPDAVVPDDLLPVFDGLEMVGDGIHLVPSNSTNMLAENTEENNISSTTSTSANREAFVLLTSESWVKKAVARSGSQVLGCTVTVRRSTPGEMRTAVGDVAALQHAITPKSKRTNGRRRMPVSPGHREPNSTSAITSGGKGSSDSYVMQSNRLDSSTTVDGITKLFAGLGLTPGDVTITEDDDGEVAVARVSFLSREARDLALAEPRLNDGSMQWEDGGMIEGSGEGNIGSAVIRMRGLPYSSTHADIMRFFDGFNVHLEDIARGKDRHGRPSGEAWVTMQSAAQAQLAVLKLDKAHMGSRYIELLISQPR